jgi:hypothetical protein
MFDLRHSPLLLAAIRRCTIVILEFAQMATSTLTPPNVPETAFVGSPNPLESYFTRLTGGAAIPWNLTTLGGLLALILLWAAWLHGTWAGWGELTADCGREMYVPTVLLHGKTLYKDIWYPYGPLGPYWNSFLFRMFGVHLNVLYWAGSLSALGCAIFLYHIGIRLSAPLAGWTAGAAVLFQAFHPSLFSFPLPYSYACVYGLLVSCLFVWLVIHAATSRNMAWIFGAGLAAAAALLLKLEFGMACYLTLALLIAARGLQQRSWKSVAQDVGVCLPGVVACGMVITWMISLRGAEFLTQENLMSWPGTFFMRTYGKFWLGETGFTITGPILTAAAKRLLVFLALVQGLHMFLSRERPDRRRMLLRGALFALALGYIFVYLTWFKQLCAVFFPQDMVLYISVAVLAAWWHFLQQPESKNALAIAILLSFSTLLAFRIMFKLLPVDFPVFYDGPAILCFLLLMRSLIPASGHSKRFVQVAEVVLCLACLAAPALHSRAVLEGIPRPAWLTTERGSIRAPKQTAENYWAAMQFMKEKDALGEAVLSIPEDTSLYFFSEVDCPTRVYAFTPGMLAPGKMTDDLVQQIERRPVRYLIWSNRLFPEYNVLRFGVDFDQTLGNYLFSHYRRVAPVTPASPHYWEWNAYIWERIPDREAR